MIDAITFLNRWKLFRSACTSGDQNPRFRKKPMGNSGFRQMSLVWNKWTAFCAARNINWSEAREADVEGYLQSIKTRGRTMLTADIGDVSVAQGAVKSDSRVTIRRYWRILDELYAFGLEERYIQHNPARRVKPEDGEGVLSEVLSGAEWCRIVERLPNGECEKSRRDRLSLLLIAQWALTTSEIVNLRLTDASVLRGASSDPAVVTDDKNAVSAGISIIYQLHLGGSRDAQTRTIVLDEMTSLAMQRWLQIRPKTPISNKLLLGDRLGCDLTAKILYDLCCAHLKDCEINLDKQRGPNTLRNSCIVNWLNDRMPIQEIMHRCGFQEPNFQRRLLRHLRPGIAEFYAAEASVMRGPVPAVSQRPQERRADVEYMPVLFNEVAKKNGTIGNSELVDALAAEWDGTPMHAKVLAGAIRRLPLDLSREAA